jgi:hypothetical protein
MWQNKNKISSLPSWRRIDEKTNVKNGYICYLTTYLGNLAKPVFQMRLRNIQKYAKGEYWNIKNNKLLTIDRRVGGMIERKLHTHTHTHIYACLCEIDVNKVGKLHFKVN